MFRSDKPAVTTFRAAYANRDDFCRVLEKEMERFYRLAFLLTADHQKAEKCFTATIDEAFQQKAVFKEWAQSWVKGRLIRNAIQIMSPGSTRSAKTDLWNVPERETHWDRLQPVTYLAPLERFVFVMSTLEHYSVRDCSLLLGCTMKKVNRAQTRALRQLGAAGERFADLEVHRPPLEAIA
jgi:DNA-directed RNA polymerase specialized sigma24 family protein